MIPFIAFEELKLSEEFEDSDFAGVDILLNIDYLRLMFVSSKDNEEVEEIYYFIEANGEVIRDDDNFVLYLLDEIKFALVDFNNEFFIVVKLKDVEEINLMFD